MEPQQAEPEQEATDKVKGLEKVIETTMAKQAERMQDVVRRSLQGQLRSLGRREQGYKRGKQDGATVKAAQQVQRQQAPKQGGVQPQENQCTDPRLKTTRYGGGWGDNTLGVDSKEGL